MAPPVTAQKTSKNFSDSPGNLALSKGTIVTKEAVIWCEEEKMGLKRKFAPRREDSEGEEGPMLMLEPEARRPTRWNGQMPASFSFADAIDGEYL